MATVGIYVYNLTSASITVGSSYTIPSQSVKQCYYTTGSSVKITASRYITSSGSTSYYQTWPSSGTISVYEYSKLTYSGDGNGYVDCDYDSGDFVRYGASVSMTPVPYTQYQFSYWSGDKSGSDNPLNFTMGYDDLDIEAHFVGASGVGVTIVNKTQVSITVGPNYTIPSQSTLVCYYTSGSIITITATVPITSTGGNTATFTWSSSLGTIGVNQHSKLTYSAGTGGTVTGDHDSGYYLYKDESFKLTAKANSEYTFSGWSNGSTANPYSSTMGYSDINLVAYFTDTPTYTYKLQFSANGGSGAPGTQSASSTASYYTFTISAIEPTRSGYTFKGWAWDPEDTTPDFYPKDTVTLYSGLPSRILYAVWSENTTGIVVYNETNSNISVGGTYTVPASSSATCYFVSGNSVTISSNVPLTSTGATSYILTWPSTGSVEVKQYSKLTFAGNYGGSVIGDHTSGTYLAYGTSVKLTADPDTGYGFYNWTDGTSNNPYSFNMGYADVDLVANFKRVYTIKFELKDTDGTISTHADGMLYDLTTSKGYGRGVEAEIFDGDSLRLLANDFDTHYHLTEWRNGDTGLIYSTSNPYEFTASADIYLVGIIDLYSTYRMTFTRVKEGEETTDWEDTWFQIGKYDSEGRIAETVNITSASMYCEYYPDEKLEVTARVYTSMNSGQRLDYVYDPYDKTYYLQDVFGYFDITPGNRNVNFQFACHYYPLVLRGRMIPAAGGTVTLSYYTDWPIKGGTLISSATSSSTEYAELSWDKETYPTGIVLATYNIYDTEKNAWKYWDVLNNNTAYRYKISGSESKTTLSLGYGDLQDDTRIGGYRSYNIWANCNKAYTYVVTTSGGSDTSFGYLLLPDGTKAYTFDYYENETVQLGIDIDDTHDFLGWTFSNMKDPSGLDSADPELSFTANDSHGVDDDFMVTYVTITALFKEKSEQKATLSYNCNVGIPLGSWSTDNENWTPFDGSVVEVTVGATIYLRTILTTDYGGSTWVFEKWEDESTDVERTITIVNGLNEVEATYKGSPSPAMIAMMLLNIALGDDEKVAMAKIIQMGKFLL